MAPVKKNLRFFFSICLFIFSYSLSSQNQYNIWYFGADSTVSATGPGAGLDFNGGPPVAIFNSAMPFTEGCATYCNSVGQILFYTNGSKVWDKTHSLMPAGDLSLSTGANALSSMQSSVIIPTYNDTNIYYLFGNAGSPTANTPGLLYYTTIDTRLNSGKGDVNASVKTLISGTSERVVGVKHCNGMDHWVVTHLINTNTFYAFRVTPCGVMDTVISTTGPVESGSQFSSLKASPKGNKLSTVLNGITIIYDFDNSTGLLTGFTPIDTAASSAVSLANMFSPDGNLFYLASGPTFPTPIYQFNLNAANIRNSKTLVGSNSGSFANFSLAYDFQIGRDGKLYLSNSDILGTLRSLDAVNSPNTLGIGCAFTNNVVSLGNRVSWLNLPNHISDYLNPLPIQPGIAGFSYSLGCASSATAFTDTSLSCAPIKSWKWNFGDPSSGVNDTSSLPSPSHIYNSPGTFTVSLIISDGCYKDTAQSAITIASAPAVTVSGDTSVCTGGASNLSVSGSATSYAWYPSSGLSSTTGSNNVASPTSTTTYSIIATFPGGCSSSSLFTVQVDDPDVSFSGNTSICSGDSTNLSLSGASSYNWYPSAGLSSTTGSSVTAFPVSTTTYNAVGISAGGCTDTIPIIINVLSQPVAQTSGATSVCSGKNVVLTASGATNVYWSPASGLSSTTGTSVTASPSANTVYTVTVSYGGATCYDTASIAITVNSLPSVVATGTNSICSGASTTIIAGGASTYSWSPSTGLSGSSGSTVTATPASTTTYTVTGTDANGCTNSFPFTVTVIPLPNANAGPDKSICIGASTSLTGSGGTIYIWSNGTSTSSNNVSPTVTTVYTLTVSNGNCSKTDAATVTVFPAPTANAGSSVSIITGGSTILSASGGGSYSWSPANGLSCTSCADPVASPQSTTVYYVTVTDGNGCTNIDSLIVTVEDICIENILISNVFTPNADGKNELFLIEGFDPCFKTYSISIYNRWGTVVFETNTPDSKFWDGRNTSGEPVPDGTYYYALNTKNGPIKGFITLLR